MIQRFRFWLYGQWPVRQAFRHPYRAGLSGLLLAIMLTFITIFIATNGADGPVGRALTLLRTTRFSLYLAGVVCILALTCGAFAIFAFRPKRRSHPLERAPSKVMLLLFVVGGMLGGIWAASLPGARPTDSVAVAAAVVGLYALWLNFRKQLVDENRFATERAQFYARQSAELFTQSVTGLSSDDPVQGIAAVSSLAELANSDPSRTGVCAGILSAYLRTKAATSANDRLTATSVKPVVEAACVALGRFSYPYPWLDLNLEGIDVKSLELHHTGLVNLDGACIQERLSIFSDVQLRARNLKVWGRLDLTLHPFSGADLDGANIEILRLQGTPGGSLIVAGTLDVRVIEVYEGQGDIMQQAKGRFPNVRIVTLEDRR